VHIWGHNERKKKTNRSGQGHRRTFWQQRLKTKGAPRKTRVRTRGEDSKGKKKKSEKKNQYKHGPTQIRISIKQKPPPRWPGASEEKGRKSVANRAGRQPSQKGNTTIKTKTSKRETRTKTEKTKGTQTPAVPKKSSRKKE